LTGAGEDGPRTLLAVLAHPDDELTVAGTLLAQRARGDRVVVLYLTRGESTGAFGPLPPDEVARRRADLAGRAAEILDVEHRFLDFPDGGVTAAPETARAVARVLAELRPDGLLTWGRGWVKGMRHPDHRETGRAAVDAVTMARIASLVEPREPWRGFCPVFTIRGVHSTLPRVVVDVEPWLEPIRELGDFYRSAIGFGDRGWLEARLRGAGAGAGVAWAEALDAWETEPGVVEALLPAPPAGSHHHPSRVGTVDGGDA
jgi:LmbE family N-acetylglucosaminyl deacetylase